MKKTITPTRARKMHVNRETLRTLTSAEAQLIAGGGGRPALCTKEGSSC